MMLALAVLFGFCLGAQVLHIASLIVSARHIEGFTGFLTNMGSFEFVKGLFSWPSFLMQAFFPEEEKTQRMADVIHVFDMDAKAQEMMGFTAEGHPVQPPDLKRLAGLGYPDIDFSYGCQVSVHTVREVMTASFEQDWQGLPDHACFVIQDGKARLFLDAEFEEPVIEHLKQPTE